eukprot:9434215-Pyramimonas_sp.AAC.1
MLAWLWASVYIVLQSYQAGRDGQISNGIWFDFSEGRRGGSRGPRGPRLERRVRPEGCPRRSPGHSR